MKNVPKMDCDVGDFRPIGCQMLCEVDFTEKMSKGGLALVNSATQPADRATIITMGKNGYNVVGEYTDLKNFKEGDRVLFNWRVTEYLKFKDRKKLYVLLQPNAIFCKLENEGDVFA